MDRFFSKLDLRDIRIKPEGNRFLPDDDEIEVVEDVPTASVETAAIELDEIDGSVYENTPLRTQVVSATYQRVTVEEWNTSVTEPDGHRALELSTSSAGDTEVLKVSAKSRPSAVAGAIAGVVRENGRAEVQAIGAGATNQAVKAIAIAREYLLETDIDAICIPAFIDVTIDDEERTAIRLVIEQR